MCTLIWLGGGGGADLVYTDAMGGGGDDVVYTDMGGADLMWRATVSSQHQC